MKVLITGDRNWTDRKAVETILALMHSVSRSKSDGKCVTLIHGDCKTGADKMADDYAHMGTMKIKKHPADWSKGKSGGPIRNSEMLKEKPDICFGFHNDIKKSKGTRDMLKKAQKAGIPTFLISTRF